MNDLANSWKVGIAFIILVTLRYFLTAQAAFFASARTSILGGIAGLSGNGRTKQNEEGATDPVEEMRGSVLEFIDSGLIALVLVFMIIRPFIVQAFYIPSGSMRPTLVENDKILVDKLSYHFRLPNRGDVIVFKAPPVASEDQKDFIKRLIALPGDVVEVRDGLVYINGKAQHEDYIAEPPDYYMAPVTVEPGKVFVMGDNRNDSNDSHCWGQLDESRIRGRAMYIFWPLSRIRAIH